MYCSTTLFGTTALPGRIGMTNTMKRYASTKSTTACQNGCLRYVFTCVPPGTHERFQLGRGELIAEDLRHHSGKLLVALRDLRVGLQNRLTNQIRRQARSDVRQVGRDRAAFAADLVAAEAACGVDDLCRIRAPIRNACRLCRPCRPRICGRGGRDIRCAYVDRPAVRFEKRDQRPELLRRECAAHFGHDRLVARHNERAWTSERLVDVGFAVLARFALAAARSDRALALFIGEQIGRAGAEAMARGAPTGAMVELVAGRHELLGCDVRPERQRVRYLALHLRDLVRDQRIERERPRSDAENGQVIRPHARPPRNSARTWISRRDRRARRCTPRATGSSARRC